MYVIDEHSCEKVWSFFDSFKNFVFNNYDCSINNFKLSKKLKKKGFKHNIVLDVNLRKWVDIWRYLDDSLIDFSDILIFEYFINIGDIIACYDSLWGKSLILFKNEEDLIHFKMVFL